MSTELFRKYIDIVNENAQINELSPDLLRRAGDAADAKARSLKGPENRDPRVAAINQGNKFYDRQISQSEKNPAAGHQATMNAYKQKLDQLGWVPVTDPAKSAEILKRLDVTEPGAVAYTAQSGEVGALSPRGNFQRTRRGMQGGMSFGTGLSDKAKVGADRRWNPNYADQDVLNPSSDWT